MMNTSRPDRRRKTMLLRSWKPKSLSFLSSVLVAAVFVPVVAWAQSAASGRPVRLVVPAAPGGSNDIISRFLADRVGPRLGQTIIIENKPGAGGVIGMDFVAKAAPDGNTLLFFSTSITTNVAAGKKLPFDIYKDLLPVGGVAAGGFVITVATNVPANNLREFLELARARPGAVTYGSAGVGGLNHIGTELIASVAGVKLLHVPYKGMAPALTDMMGGQVQMALPSLASLVPFIKSGRLKPLAITSPQRFPTAPDIPTASESGMPNFNLEVWWGLMTAARTPAEVIRRFNGELNAVLSSAEAKEKLANDGIRPIPGSPEDFGALLRGDIERWARVIKDANITID